jgi:RNA 3'-terminal phosphate cyclase (ATP)
MAAPRFAPSKPSHVHLNGRTLEGGGQLVRIAIGLSALTGRPVSIDHVRGNRQGKKGLKRSHAAAVNLLAEISGSEVSGSEVGSQYLNFLPQSSRSKNGPLRDLSQVTVKSEYDISLTTAGAIFLVFQALYPYLLHVGSRTPGSFVKVNITGGTNSSHSPSYDYVSQVIVPNFARLGLPPLSVILHKRGWSSGPIDLGAVTFLIHALGARQNSDDGKERNESPGKRRRTEPVCAFPRINLMDHKRGKVTQIDVTVLAPDHLALNAGLRDGAGRTVRQFIEESTQRSLRRELQKMDPSMFDEHSASSPQEGPLTKQSNQPDAPIPIKIHTSEPTQHRSHVYILIVAHTSSGFRIAHDILGSIGGNHSSKPNNKGKRKQQPAQTDSQNASILSGAADLVNRCVKGFIEEISIESPQGDSDEKPASDVKRSCVDQFMRDQIVVFEALGEACHTDRHDAETTDPEILEDERDWTLHTKTAQWVCRQMLGA